MFKSLDVPNENQPSTENLQNPDDFFALLTNGYNTWYNGSIAASPTMAFACAELFVSGTNSWGSGNVWFKPRRTLFNDEAPDPVVIINFGAWYNYYGSVGLMVKLAKMFQDPNFKIVTGGIDYTQRAKAHTYLIEALLYGNIALLYDKAYLFTEDSGDSETFDYVANTRSYQDVMAFAMGKLDEAISIIEANDVDADPTSVIAGVTFDKDTLLQFANSIAARFLVENARTQEENAGTDWDRVRKYAEKGLQSNFAVEYTKGWEGKVMTRDEGCNYFSMYSWGWQRAGQWLLHKMAPNDIGGTYPIPADNPAYTANFKQWPAISNCPDKRLDKYFKFQSLADWWGADKYSRAGYGTYILSQYQYWRYHDVVDQESGYVDHFLKMENDTYLAEALIHQHGDKSIIASLINNTRVGEGGLPAISASASYDELEEALFYERYVESDLVWPQLGFYDRRRNKDQMMEGTVRHFPIPAPELNLHEQPIYTFGGVGKEM